MLSRGSGLGRWLDYVTFRDSEAKQLLYVAELHAMRRNAEQAFWYLLRAMLHWPFLSLRTYRSAYWLCLRLVKG